MSTKSRVLDHGLPAHSSAYTDRYARFHTFVRRDEETHDLTGFFSHLQGKQITVSESHPGWRSRKSGRFTGDVGGPFSTTKRTVSTLSAEPVTLTGSDFDPYWQDGSLVHYEGPYLPCAPGNMQWPDFATSSKDDLDELGTHAIAMCAPSNSVADLSVMLGEIVKDGIPHLLGGLLKQWKSLTNQERRKAIAGEHLNYEFGWKPLVSDLRKMYSAISRGDALWAQYERDAHKVVRRRFEFPEVEETNITDMGPIGPWTNPSFSQLMVKTPQFGGKVLREDHVTKRRWFSGGFIYYLPEGEGLRNEVAMNIIQAKKILGVTLTPETLWNLAPWSWATDWFASTGDVIHNWSSWAIDGQVLLYGYMMEHSIAERTYTWSGPTNFQSGVVPLSVTLRSESKIRIQATPYGFGVKGADLSARQLAIIGSLGLSKGK